VQARIGNFLPYPGYPTASKLIDALRPFPQYSTIGATASPIAVTGSPTGNTWFDSLQVKLTKRMSRGLQVNGTYTYSKALTSTRQDVFNPNSSAKSVQSTDQPHVIAINILYQVPKIFSNPLLNTIAKDWQFGSFLQYGSGTPLLPPAAQVTNNLPGGSEMYRTGQPLSLKDINCHCYDPTHTQVLNPAAWANPAAGTYGPGPSDTRLGFASSNLYYSDFRGPRRPSESFNIARNFRLSKGDRPVTLSVRGEFANIFNRTLLPTPVTTMGGIATNKAGQYTNGFGVIQEVFATGGFPSAANVLPRTGTIVARVNF